MKPLLTRQEILDAAQQRKQAKLSKQIKRGVKKRNPDKGHRFPELVNEPLRAYVRGLQCLVLGQVDEKHGGFHRCQAPIVPAHLKTRGSGGGDDDNMVPLCVRAHQLQEGRTKEFEWRFGIQLKPIARRITAQFYRDYPELRKVQA